MKINVGIVVAKEEDNLSELKKYLKDSEVDVLLLPEGYIVSEQLEEACRLAKQHGKWLITSMEDTREVGHKYQTGVVISPDGLMVGEHKKTSITSNEEDNMVETGDDITAIDTPFGKVGIAVCFEIHFPEIARVYALQGARIIFNPIGTGMWNEEQFKQWSSIACARASENGVFMLGCSHFNYAIPIAYAYTPRGECLALVRDSNSMVKVSLDIDAFKPHDFGQRRPDLYGELIAL
jgi:predicted amidohydrolase